MKKRILLASGIALAALATQASAQVPNLATVKNDNQWRAAFAAGLSYASGNTKSSSLSLSGDAVRASSMDKWTLGGRYLRGRSNGADTADQLVLGTRYDRDLSGPWFAFGQAGFLKDRLANLSQEYTAGAGVGYHVIRTEPLTWDVFGGVGYVYDRYITPAYVADQTRSNYGRTELILGEESSHKFNESTSFKQRLVVYPNMRDSGAYRAAFDAGLLVAMNKSLALTATLGYRYNSDPGVGLKKGDALFITGVTYRME